MLAAAKGKIEDAGLNRLSNFKEIFKREWNDVYVFSPLKKSQIICVKGQLLTVHMQWNTRNVGVVLEAQVEKALRLGRNNKIVSGRRYSILPWYESAVSGDSYCQIALSHTIGK